MLHGFLCICNYSLYMKSTLSVQVPIYQVNYLFLRFLVFLDSKYQKDDSLLIFFYSGGHIFFTVVFAFFAVQRVLVWCSLIRLFLLLALGQWKFCSESYWLPWKVSHDFLLQFQRFWSYFKVFVKNLWYFLFKQSIWVTWIWTQMPRLHATLFPHSPIMYPSVMFSQSLRRLCEP